MYPERIYQFGDQLVLLRTRLGLTQAAFAAAVEVHRRSVQNWETGVSYPKAEKLQRIIAVFLHRHAFMPGSAYEEAEALWNGVARAGPHPLPAFDQTWFEATASRSDTLTPQARALIDWGEAAADDLDGLDLQDAGGQDANASGAAGSGSSFTKTLEGPHTTGSSNAVLGLPFQATPFVGRGAEVAEIRSLLADPACRMLTLLGPGGIGKTRLAQEVASACSDAFVDGAVFVALAAVGAPAQIVSAICDALNLTLASQRDPLAHLLAYLHERQMLLVLDNFEHLLDGAELIGGLLAHAASVKLLVTSRERLHLQAEWLFEVGGLAYPSDEHAAAQAHHLVDLTDYSAVQLFAQRATQVQPGIAFTEAAIATIIRICQQVAGMPLAIELAAAAVRTMPLTHIEHQIRSTLDTLATTLRDVPARHRSMRAAFEHSWHLLSERERALFSALAVFHGGWSAAAAERVTGATPQALAALVDKSLVRRESALVARSPRAVPTTAAEPRYTLLAPIREYALERFGENPDADGVRRRHAHFYTLLAEAAAAEWDTPQINAAIALQRREHDNMRAALAWACDGGNTLLGLRLGWALWGFWRSYGYGGEGRVWFERLLRHDDHSPDPAAKKVRQRGLHAAAWLASDQHDYAAAAQLFEESVALRRELGEAEGATDLLLNAARQARAAGQYQQATALLEDALPPRGPLGERVQRSGAGIALSFLELGQVLRELALVLRERGNFSRAVDLLEESLALYEASGDRVSVALALLGLSDVARDQGDSARMRQYGEPALAIFRETGMHWAIGFALNNLALAALLANELPHALALATQSVATFRDLGSDASRAEALITLGTILHTQGENAAASATLAEALQLALTLGPRLMVLASAEALACVLAARGQADLVVRLLAVAAAARAAMDAPLRPADAGAVEAALATARASLGDEACEAIWSDAATKTLEQNLGAVPNAVARALSRGSRSTT